MDTYNKKYKIIQIVPMISDLWDIVLQYLDDIQLETSEFFEKHLDKLDWYGLPLNTNIVKQEKHKIIIQL